MKATLGSLPADDGRWAYEIKWDGYRTLCHVTGRGVRLQSSNNLDVTAKYPELAGLGESVNATSVILDGELVIVDEHGRPRFELLQNRGANTHQAAFYAFDVLHVDGTDTISLPYEQRRDLLADVLEAGTHWLVPGHQIGDGAALLDVVADRHLEGVMAKRLGSTYQPGRRSPNWRKVKVRRTVTLVVGGFSKGTGNRASTFGSLLVGLPDGDHLRFAGGVGTGFDQRTLEALTEEFRALATPVCPFDPPPPPAVRREAIWVDPVVRIDAQIAEFTNEGLVRHSSFVGLRRD